MLLRAACTCSQAEVKEVFVGLAVSCCFYACIGLFLVFCISFSRVERDFAVFLPNMYLAAPTHHPLLGNRRLVCTVLFLTCLRAFCGGILVFPHHVYFCGWFSCFWAHDEMSCSVGFLVCAFFVLFVRRPGRRILDGVTFNAAPGQVRQSFAVLNCY